MASNRVMLAMLAGMLFLQRWKPGPTIYRDEARVNPDDLSDPRA